MAAAKKKTAEVTKQTARIGRFKRDEGPMLHSRSTKMDVIRALNWAAAEREVKELAPFVEQYMAKQGHTKERIRAATKNDVLLTPTDFALCRLGVLGDLPADIKMNLDKRLNEAADQVIAREKPAAGVRQLPRSATIVAEAISELDAQIDVILEGGKAMNSPYAYLNELQLSSAQLASIANWIDATVAQYEALEDPNVAAYYSRKFKHRYRAIMKYLALVQTDVNTLRDNAKRARKKRKLSTATITKRTEKAINTTLSALKYQSEDEATRTTSLNPSKVFGAGVVTLYNARNRTVHLLRCAEGKTMSIKKQTVTGFDPDLSFQCKLRSPSRYLSQMASASKAEAIRIAEKVLKTTKKPTRGRITETTLIINAFTH